MHNAEGQAKVIRLDGVLTSIILRLEILKTINAPDLYVHLSTDKSAFCFVTLAGLRAI